MKKSKELTLASQNEIIIHSTKDSWGREEVQSLINSFADYHNINWLDSRTKEWIKENLQ